MDPWLGLDCEEDKVVLSFKLDVVNNNNNNNKSKKKQNLQYIKSFCNDKNLKLDVHAESVSPSVLNSYE